MKLVRWTAREMKIDYQFYIFTSDQECVIILMEFFFVSFGF